MTGRFEEPADGAPGHAVSAAGEVPRPVRFSAGAAASAAGSRRWATADDLLRFARWQLEGGPAADRAAPWHADVPGRGFADGWALGWGALGSRAVPGLRMVGLYERRSRVLADLPRAGRGARGADELRRTIARRGRRSAMFDHVSPACWPLLGVGAPVLPSGGPGRPVAALTGAYGPVTVNATDDDRCPSTRPRWGSAYPWPTRAGTTTRSRRRPPAPAACRSRSTTTSCTSGRSRCRESATCACCGLSTRVVSSSSARSQWALTGQEPPAHVRYRESFPRRELSIRWRRRPGVEMGPHLRRCRAARARARA